MISIKPKWCVKIMNGEKTIEVRKNKALASAIQKLIDENGYADIYVYCSKSNYFGYISNRYIGKIIFKFRCYKVERFEWYSCGRDNDGYWLDNGERFDLKPTCLTYKEMFDYIGDKQGYAIHISNLEIFKPKELSEFYTKGYLDYIEHCENPRYPEIYKDIHKCILTVAKHKFKLTKAPQNMVYIEVE